MEVAYVSALSALAGSVVGGLTTGFTTWMSGRSQAQAGRLVADVARRQDLFREFIIAASKTYADALVNTKPEHTGSRRSLGHGQSNASSVLTTNDGERREDNAPDYGHLLCSPKDTRRTARADKKRGRNGSPSGIQRGGAGRTARSRPLMRHISRANASDGSIVRSGVVAQALSGPLRTAGC